MLSLSIANRLCLFEPVGFFMPGSFLSRHLNQSIRSHAVTQPSNKAKIMLLIFLEGSAHVRIAK